MVTGSTAAIASSRTWLTYWYRSSWAELLPAQDDGCMLPWSILRHQAARRSRIPQPIFADFLVHLGWDSIGHILSKDITCEAVGI